METEEETNLKLVKWVWTLVYNNASAQFISKKCRGLWKVTYEIERKIADYIRRPEWING